DARVKGVGQIGDQQADDTRGARTHAARNGIRLVIELACRLGYGGDRLLADAPRAIACPGGGCRGHTGLLCYLPDGDPTLHDVPFADVQATYDTREANLDIIALYLLRRLMGSEPFQIAELRLISSKYSPFPPVISDSSIMPLGSSGCRK